MFWLALLVLALIGFNRPRRALGRALASASVDLLKILTFAGVALFFAFGFLGLGTKMNFFVALLPAAGVWLGVLAGVEQLRRQRGTGGEGASASIEIDPVWQQRREQQQAGERGKLFSDDPWGVVAAQSRGASAEHRRPGAMFNRIEVEPEPAVELYRAPEPENAGGLLFVPPESADAAEQSTRGDLVSVLRQHADKVEHGAAAGEREHPAEDEPQETADADDAEQPVTAEPVPGQGAAQWLKEEEPAGDVDPGIDRRKQDLEAQPREAQGGRYRYKPQLIKSLFSSDDE